MSGPGPARGLHRRHFLLAGGGIVSAGLLGGCGDGGDTPRPEDTPVVTDPNRLEGDLSVAALLVSLENLLVSVYQEGLDRKDQLADLSPAVLAVVEAAQRQHREHSTAWNSILTSAGKPGVSGVNLPVKSETSDPALVRMRDAGALLTLGLELETITASTYLASIGAIQNLAALKLAASIQPVENAHAAVIAAPLGRPLPPESTGSTAAGRPLSDPIG